MDFEKNGTMHNLNFLTEVEVWSQVLTSLFKSKHVRIFNEQCVLRSFGDNFLHTEIPKMRSIRGMSRAVYVYSMFDWFKNEQSKHLQFDKTPNTNFDCGLKTPRFESISDLEIEGGSQYPRKTLVFFFSIFRNMM